MSKPASDPYLAPLLPPPEPWGAPGRIAAALFPCAGLLLIASVLGSKVGTLAAVAGCVLALGLVLLPRCTLRTVLLWAAHLATLYLIVQCLLNFIGEMNGPDRESLFPPFPRLAHSAPGDTALLRTEGLKLHLSQRDFKRHIWPFPSWTLDLICDDPIGEDLRDLQRFVPGQRISDPWNGRRYFCARTSSRALPGDHHGVLVGTVLVFDSLRTRDGTWSRVLLRDDQWQIYRYPRGR